MNTRLLALLCAVLPCGAAQAQMSPPAGVLQAPSRSAPAKPEAPVTPPKAAPRPSVQQVAPFASPVVHPPQRSALGTATPGKPPPVVAPKANTQPQKPPGATPAKPPAAAAAGVAAGAAVGAAAAPPPPPKPAEPTKGSATGQPLPRWAGILYDGVKLRVGPGQRYPVDWIYRRPDQPVRVLREFETWRLVEDHEGVKGWVHQSNLTGRRSFMVKDKDTTLRRTAADDAAAVAVLKPGVVGRVRGCAAEAAWCEVRVGDYRGWIKRDALWGVSAGEAVGN